MLRKFRELTVRNVWDNIIVGCLYLTVFLVPVLFLPWTVYQVAWNKQFFLVWLVLIAFIAWLIKSIVRGEIVYVKSRLNGVAALLLLLVALSAAFSGSRSLGLLGMTGAEVSSLLTMAALVMMFWLVSASSEVGFLSYTLAISSVLALVVGLLQMLGGWLLPWDFARAVTFNTIGTNNVAALFFGFLFVVSFVMLYFKNAVVFARTNILAKTCLWTATVVSFLTVLGMSFWAVFADIGLAMVVIMAVDLLARKEKAVQSIIWPAVVLAICLFLVAGNFIPFLRPTFLPSFKLPAEVMPSFSASWHIVKATAEEGWKNFLLGAGPGTFQYQYGLYHSPDLNATDFWGVRFAYGLNAILTHLVDWGMAGTLVWLLFLALAVIEAVRSLRQWPVLSLGLIYLVTSLFFYPQNIVIYFLIFLLAGLLVKTNTGEKDYKHMALASTPTKTFGLSLLLMVLIMLAASVIFVQGQRYLGSIYFNNALRTYNQTGDVEKTLPEITSALDLDPRNDLYLQNLSQAYLLRLNNIISGSRLPLAELQAQFANNLGAAIQAAKRATEINSRDSQNWITLGRVYENVILLVPGAAELAIDAYARAQQLEPHNPIIATALGRSYMLTGDYLGRTNNRSNRDKAYAAAILALEGAVQMKPDYTPAHFLLVQIYDRQGRVREAIVRAETIRSLSPNDVGLIFQLGLLHYRVGRYPNARVYFERAVELFPNYSNARYFLGLIYDRDGQRARALDEFEKIAELNPDNTDVQAIIHNLRLGRPALEGGVALKATVAPIEEGGKETKRPTLKR